MPAAADALTPFPAFPKHVAIIMDGNGRWAVQRGFARAAGHAAGARAVRRTVEAARVLGIPTLTLYAFSSDNWKRPRAEVNVLMRLFAEYLREELARCREHGIRLTIVGRRDRLGSALRRAIDDTERATADGAVMDLRIAIDYSARDAIVRAAALAGRDGGGTREAARATFAGLLARAMHARTAAGDVDLLIRTGGEHRLSDFLLWECAYAELVFTDRAWPEFCAADLEDAIAEFRQRDRRFGALATFGAQSA
jgi:undecaprenyl diphosphate synthase